MRKPLIGAFLTLIVSLVTLWGNSFWKEKEFTEWSQKEVIRIMTKSPWSQRVAILLPGRDQGGAGRDQRGAGRNGGQLRDPSRVPAQTGPFLMGRTAGGREEKTFVVTTPKTPGGDPEGRFHLNLTVRWYALPLRHARARWEELLSPEKNSQENRRTGAGYVIGISGLPTRFLAGEAKRLKVVFDRVRSDSFLKIKGRDPIVASGLWLPANQGVVNLRSAPWRSGGEFYVLFPRDKKDGYVITLEDKKVEFVTRIGSLEVKRKFKLKDMVYNGNLEL